MDVERWENLLKDIESGKVQLIAKDTSEPVGAAIKVCRPEHGKEISFPGECRIMSLNGWISFLIRANWLGAG